MFRKKTTVQKNSPSVNVLLSLLMAYLLCLAKYKKKHVTSVLSNCLVQRKFKLTEQKPSHL